VCGIAGIVSLVRRPVRNARARLKTMQSMLHHRGPDQRGIFLSENGFVGMVNTRLAIVGVADTLRLPMQDADGLGVLTFNGEIYNYKDLRSELVATGARFQTSTDTEVLLAGLISDDLDFVRRADGFWSFGYFDQLNRKFHLARDLMGEKSLFYAIVGQELIFASEVPPILAVMGSDVDWDEEAVACAFQYRAAPPGRTLIRQISRLAAGFVLSLKPGSGELELRRLQKFAPDKWREFFEKDPSREEVLDLFEEQIQLSCRRRIPAEVDYISTLSGGIDSTLINVFLSDKGKRRISSLYAHSSDLSPQRGNDLSEYEASKFSSHKLRTDYHEFSMYGEDAISLQEEDAATAYDGIFCEGVNNFRLLARYTRSLGKRVLVTSDGPDELFGGYVVDSRAFRNSRRLEGCDTDFRQRAVGRAFDIEHASRTTSSLINWAYLNSEPFAVRPNHGGTRPETMHSLFEAPLALSPLKQYGQISADYDLVADGMDVSQKIAMGYACTSLPDYVNTRSDRGSMRESVETRLPFQAPYLAELFLATPAKWRFGSGGWSKYILRSLVERHIGPQVANRGKYGFAAPLWWSAEGQKKLRMRETVADSAIFSNFPFRNGAREFVLKSGEERHCWMAYCLAKTYDHFRSNFAGQDSMKLLADPVVKE
jgi:asparagine synthase (glutamine-hydrolysing)